MTALIALAFCTVIFIVPACTGLEREFWGVKYCFSSEQPGTNLEYNPRTDRFEWCGFPNFESKGTLENSAPPQPVEDAPRRW